MVTVVPLCWRVLACSFTYLAVRVRVWCEPHVRSAACQLINMQMWHFALGVDEACWSRGSAMPRRLPATSVYVWSVPGEASSTSRICWPLTPYEGPTLRLVGRWTNTAMYSHGGVVKVRNVCPAVSILVGIGCIGQALLPPIAVFAMSLSYHGDLQ